MEFLPNTDNFFKYLLTAGLVLIAFTIVYPVQKQKEIDIEMLALQERDSLLSYEVVKFQRAYVELKEKSIAIQAELDSLKVLAVNSTKLQANRIDSDRIKLKQNFDSTKKQLLSYGDSLKLKELKLRVFEEKIKRLEGYYNHFRSFKLVFIIFGLALVVVGIRYWASSVYQDELKKSKDINSGKNSAFVRHVDQYCSRSFRLSIIFCIVVIILLLVIVYLIVI